jgi:outer membrane receptor for ferrienterochelin and colicin
VDPRFTSNPALVPLNARTIDVGLRCERFQLIGASFSAYRSWVKDDIFSDPATGGNNNANAVRQGAELAVDLHPVSWMDCDVSTAYTDAHFADGLYQGHRQVLVPTWEIKGGLNLRPVDGWTWRVEASQLTGVVRFNDLPNRLPKSAYTLVNTKVSYQLRGYAAYVAVNNVLNERYEQFPSYSPFVGALRYNPAPGVNFQVGVNLAF